MEPPFKRANTTCDLSSLDYSSIPIRNAAFENNFDSIVPANIALPQDFSDGIRLVFPIGNSPLFLDPLSMAYRMVFQVVNADGTEIVEGNKKIGFICGFLYTSISENSCF